MLKNKICCTLFLGLKFSRNFRGAHRHGRRLLTPHFLCVTVTQHLQIRLPSGFPPLYVNYLTLFFFVFSLFFALCSKNNGLVLLSQLLCTRPRDRHKFIHPVKRKKYFLSPCFRPSISVLAPISLLGYM